MLSVGSLIVVAQLADKAEDDGTRQLWDTVFLQKRPAGKTGRNQIPQKRKVYKKVTSSVITPVANQTSTEANKANSNEGVVVGLTIWRLRPSNDSKGGARLLVQEKEGAQTTEWTPERIDAETPLSEGERLRLTIEVPSDGYLYVIDREKYADGTFSDPYLIFPTTRTRGGDNKVAAGRVIEIPAQDDNPSYFNLKSLQSEKNYIGEVLTVLVSTKPIEDLKIGSGPIKLSKEQLAQWEKKWSAQTELYAMIGGEGKAYTKEEKAAGAGGTLLLTQDDPLPQTLYRVAAKPGAPILFTVPLQIGRIGK
jgi:hypothetical protein